MLQILILMELALLSPFIMKGSDFHLILSLNGDSHQSTSFMVDDSLSLSVSDKQLKISHNDGDACFEIADVIGFRYQPAISTSVETLKEQSIVVHLSPNNLVMTLSPGQSSCFQLYNMDGKCILDLTIKDEFSLDLSKLEAGVYILNYANNQSLKFMIK